MGEHYLFVITGPSGCGKTTLLLKLASERNIFERKFKFWEKTAKYSTRHPRTGEKDDAGNTDVLTPDIKDTDDEETIKIKKTAMRDKIEKNCNIIYTMNNELYGFSTEDINTKLKDSHVAVVLSDFGVIKLLKDDPSYKLNGKIITLYISSCVSPEDLTKVWLSRYTDFKGAKKDQKNGEASKPEIKNVDKLLDDLEQNVNKLAEIRLSNDDAGYKAFDSFYTALHRVIDIQGKLMPDSSSYIVRIDRLKSFYFKYIIDIGLFDYVILNYFDKRENEPSIEDMTIQVKNIIEYLNKNNTVSRPKDPVFFVCAAPKSGKSILMKNLNIMGNKQIKVIDKQSLREAKRNDGRDKMHPIIDLTRCNNDEETLEVLKHNVETFSKESDADYRRFEYKRKIYCDRIQKFFNTLDERAQKIVKLAIAVYRNNNIIDKAKLEELEQSIVDLAANFDPENNVKVKVNIGELNRLFNSFAAIEKKHIDSAKQFFDARYNTWNWRFHDKYYGIDLDAIQKQGKDRCEKEGRKTIPVIMISNMQQLNAAKEIVGNRLVPIFLTFVGNNKSNREFHLSNVGKGKVHKTKYDAKKTLKEIDSIRAGYYENIGAFRHVLLNSGIDEDLHDQIINIVRLYR
jgi:hypothetical protein